MDYCINYRGSQNFFLADKEYIYKYCNSTGNFILYLIGIIGFTLLMRLKKISWEEDILNPICFKLLPPVFGGKVNNETRNTGVYSFALDIIVTM